MFIAHLRLHLHVYSTLQLRACSLHCTICSAGMERSSTSSLMTCVAETQAHSGGYLSFCFMLFRLFGRVPFDSTLLSFRLFRFRRFIFGCGCRVSRVVHCGLVVINLYRQGPRRRLGLLGSCAVRYKRMFEHVLWIRWTRSILVHDGLVLWGGSNRRLSRNDNMMRYMFRS